MKGHLGAVLTSGLAVLALALALLQSLVLVHGAPRIAEASAPRAPPASNRYSAPGGRAGIPYMPIDKPSAPRTPPSEQEGSSPPPQREHRSPPPSRLRTLPVRPGPQPARKLAA
jgi:hypothetical protein